MFVEFILSVVGYNFKLKKKTANYYCFLTLLPTSRDWQKKKVAVFFSIYNVCFRFSHRLQIVWRQWFYFSRKCQEYKWCNQLPLHASIVNYSFCYSKVLLRYTFYILYDKHTINIEEKGFIDCIVLIFRINIILFACFSVSIRYILIAFLT